MVTGGEQVEPGVTAPLAVVVGPPGAGKTTTGRALAALLEVPFLDTDEQVVATTGRSVSEIFVDDGEPAFRALEREAVGHALTTERGVVALGGGAPIQPEIRELLRGHRVVFLDVTIADASRRIGFDASRPLLNINPRGSWIAMMNDRRPLYEAAASERVDTNGRSAQEVAVIVSALLRPADDSPQGAS